MMMHAVLAASMLMLLSEEVFETQANAGLPS
jgi:hypothetical protein